MGRPEKLDPTLRRKLGLLRSEVLCSIHQAPTPIAGCLVQSAKERLAPGQRRMRRLASKQPLRLLSKEEIGRYVEQLGELLRLRLADRSLSAHHLRGYAAGTKHVEQVALAQAVLFHQAAQPAVGRRSSKGVVGVLEGFDKHGQEFGV